jgi:hypothetical protein
MTSSESSIPRQMTIGDRVGWAAAFAGVLAFAGFVAGFMGPMVFEPESNQGPLLGIFFTGPLGVVLGIVLGIILPLVTAKRNWLVAALVIASVLYRGGWWLYLAVTPDPGRAPATAPAVR